MSYRCLATIGLPFLFAVVHAAQFQTRPLLDLILSVESNSGNVLKLKVVLRNSDVGSLSVDIPDREPPFRVSIFDESGRDLYQLSYANEAKDGKSAVGRSGQRLKTISFQKNESKEYNLLISGGYDRNGRPVPFTRGKYRIQVSLATVKYIDGRYQTELYQSQIAEVTLQ